MAAVLTGSCMNLAVTPIEMSGQLPLLIFLLMKPFKDNIQKK